MGEYWATRTGRWRQAMQTINAPTLGDRLYEVIRKDVEAGLLPPGALLPATVRVASDLLIAVRDVQLAYARLLAAGCVEERPDGALCISRNGEDVSIGDATQIRFEAALIRAVREAAARGLSTSEATGMFKAAALRIERMERDKTD
jgi:DNA-binding transcriptional regulator YhcF (GntR family)